MTKQVIYTAAHSGFSLGRVPLGGGAAVCAHLVEEWTNTEVFPFRLLGPDILGEKAAAYNDLVGLSEWQYARFCRDFAKALENEIIHHNPKETIVLCNDVSEGPPFKRLAEKGYSIYTIYHVDVVDYFTRLYLKSWVSPQTAVRVYDRIERWLGSAMMPGVLKLVFEKQRESALYSQGLIVPTQAMKEVLLACYPQISPDKIHVLPWGIWAESVNPAEVEQEKKHLRREYSIPEDAFVLLTLSRISPEKGQDRLLMALAELERLTSRTVIAVIAGQAAFMQGAAFERRLQKLAKNLKKIKVIFPGYAAGAKKQALFQLSNLYVFPSRHESYGLTLMEALQAGLPALATASYGAKAVLTKEAGMLIPNGSDAHVARDLASAIVALAKDPVGLKEKGVAGREYALSRRFAWAASNLAQILQTMAKQSIGISS